MTALSSAARFCRELDQRHISYSVLVARDDALMVCVPIPGERWEIEFFDDEHVELERFVSQGVVDAPDALSRLLERVE